MTRRYRILLLAALLAGLLVRVPGVLWGFNFPTGWHIHHSDEYPHWILTTTLIDPLTPPSWYHPYPKGLGAHVAVPFLLLRAVQGKLRSPLPDMTDIVVLGRVIDVLYGTATIFLVFLLARRLFRDQRVALLAAWMMALGGLHVTQSHFFVADVPSLFWLLLGSYLLILEMEEKENANIHFPYLMGTSLAYGVAFGIKLVLVGLPSLAIIVLWRRPRILRIIYAVVFFLFGFMVINLLSFNHVDLLRAITRGISDPFLWHWWDNLFLYLVEMPGLASLPVLILASVGSFFLLRRYSRMERNARFWSIALAVLLPNFLHGYMVAFQTDHFLRHLIPFIPWMSIVAAWCLVAAAQRLAKRKLSPTLLYAPVFLYLALFVFDGERVFIREPRNQAAQWLLENLPPGGSYSWREHDGIPSYQSIYYPYEGKPDVVIVDMHHANHYLSGMGLKNSFPRDARYIFEGRSQEVVDTLQALFKGETEYREVARFGENYFMPEYLLVNRVIGNRSRNYIAEVVVFKKDALRDK